MDYFIGHGIDRRFSGIERAELNRLALFKQMGRPAKILRFSFTRMAHDDAALWGLADEDIINMFDWYQDAITVARSVVTPSMVQPAKTRAVAGGREGDVQAVNYVAGDQVVAQVRYDIPTNAVNNVLWTDDAGRVRRTDSYDTRGFKTSTSFFTSGNRMIAEEYYTPAGELALRFEYNGDKGRGTTKITTRDFGDLPTSMDLERIFLQALAKQEPSRFFFDRDYTAHFLTQVPLDARKFYVVHNNHRAYKRIQEEAKVAVMKQAGVSMKPKQHGYDMNQAILANPGDIDAVMVSTQQQKEALAVDYPQTKPVYVIPVGVEVTQPKRVQWSERRTQEIIVVSRISTEKGIEDSIEAMIRVHQEFPQAHMSVYGGPNGPLGQLLLQNLQQRLVKAGLVNVVTFMGFKEKLDTIYDQAALFLMTSHTEAFSISLQEALAHGCPVVSYDIEFGPRDMIEDGVNGMLVPYGDLDGVVNAVTNLLRTPATLQSLSNGAYRLRKKYGADAVWQQYQQLPETKRLS